MGVEVMCVDELVFVEITIEQADRTWLSESRVRARFTLQLLGNAAAGHLLHLDDFHFHKSFKDVTLNI